MAQLNIPTAPAHGPLVTEEGAPAYQHLTPLQELRRSVLGCLLWEREFYEDGAAIADRLASLAAHVAPQELAALAIEARTQHHLRHVPLLLLDVLTTTGAGTPGLVASAIAATIQRADELMELLAIYWRHGKKPLSAQLKKGLAQAFRHFDAYQLAKYDRGKAIRLRDVLFLTHAKPISLGQAVLWKRLIDRTLPSPETWEVELSAGKNTQETFERLLRKEKLGYIALLRNLRTMVQAGCNPALIHNAILARHGAARVLPFRFIAAARAVPQLDLALDTALLATVDAMPPLPGHTIVLVDVSFSMHDLLSARSDLTRMDAAAALAAVIPGDVRVFSFSAHLVEVPPRRGLAGVDAVLHSQPHGNTYLGKAVSAVNHMPHDRLIVITDEQSHDPVPNPIAPRAYMINVASAKNGVGYGSRWVHLDGFSENVLTWIAEYERLPA